MVNSKFELFHLKRQLENIKINKYKYKKIHYYSWKEQGGTQRNKL